jgi:hypothetical protein
MVLCRSELWDLSLTWNTESPDFTPCFHATVLVYIPALVLLIGKEMSSILADQ